MKKYLLLLIVSGVVLVTGIVVASMLLDQLVPYQTTQPYFGKDLKRVSGLNWHLRTFQPILLYQYGKDGKVVLFVGYRESNGWLKIANVQMLEKQSLFDSNKNEIPLTSLNGFGNFGKQIRMDIITKKESAEVDAEVKDYFCNKVESVVCELLELPIPLDDSLDKAMAEGKGIRGRLQPFAVHLQTVGLNE